MAYKILLCLFTKTFILSFLSLLALSNINPSDKPKKYYFFTSSGKKRRSKNKTIVGEIPTIDFTLFIFFVVKNRRLKCKKV